LNVMRCWRRRDVGESVAMTCALAALADIDRAHSDLA
jgi:hypothetical protein